MEPPAKSMRRRDCRVSIGIGDGFLTICDLVNDGKLEVALPPDGQFQKVYLNAADACDAYLPVVPGLGRACRAALKELDKTGEALRQFGFFVDNGYTNIVEDNPGHLYLALRELTGANVNRAQTAYITSLFLAQGMSPDNAEHRAAAACVHARVCKALGMCFSAPPIPLQEEGNRGMDPVATLCDMLFAINPAATGNPHRLLPSDKASVMAAVRAWTAPLIVRLKEPYAASRWSLSLPGERIHTLMTLGATNMTPQSK